MVLFPAWLSKAGSPDEIVYDQVAYNASVAQGYSYPTQAATGANVTPMTVVAKTGALTTTIVQIAMNREQDDGRVSNSAKKG